MRLSSRLTDAIVNDRTSLIYDRQATHRICTLSGIDLHETGEKITTLKQLRDGLQKTLDEAKSANSNERLGAKLLLFSKIVQTISESILFSADAFSGPLGHKIKDIYEVDKAFGEGASSGGAQGGYESTVLKMSEIVLKDKIKERGGDAGIIGYEFGKKHGMLVKKTIEGKVDGSVVAEHVIDSKLYALEKSLPKDTKPAEIIKAARVINKAGFDLYRIGEEFKKNMADSDPSKNGSILTTEKELRRIISQIDALRSLAADCENPKIQMLLP